LVVLQIAAEDIFGSEQSALRHIACDVPATIPLKYERGKRRLLPHHFDSRLVFMII